MSEKTPPPVVEASPSPDHDELTARSLRQRIRQQEILAELGVIALQGPGFEALLDETARLTAEGLRADFSKVLEFLPAEHRFVVRAGVGWGPGVVGHATIGADLASPAGYALHTGKPVISNHLDNEQRFRTPELLQQHGIQRAMNVILQGDGRPFGVLEVDSNSEDEFSEHDLAFLQGAANILGMAIERERHERHLKAAVERQEFLVREMNHRVKNSLTIVASVLQLQSRDVGDKTLTTYLDEAARRVAAVARAHEQLFRSPTIERMDVGQYIEMICKDVDESVAQYEIRGEMHHGIEIATDRAISTALIVNELITNAVKYAYDGRAGGSIWVTIAPAGETAFFVAVRDEGAGLPDGFDIERAKGLGMRLINAFTRQLKGSITVRSNDPGTEFRIDIPREIAD